MFVPSAVTKQAEIDTAIQRVRQSIGPDVVRIRYEIGEDWSARLTGPAQEICTVQLSEELDL